MTWALIHDRRVFPTSRPNGQMSALGDIDVCGDLGYINVSYVDVS